MLLLLGQAGLVAEDASLRDMLVEQQKLIAEQGQAILRLQDALGRVTAAQQLTSLKPTARRTTFASSDDGPACVPLASDPPDILGSFTLEAGSVRLYSNTTAPFNDTPEIKFRFSATEPAHSLHTLLRKNIKCGPTTPGCVNGVLESSGADVCAWFHGGCSYSLYCVDQEDTSVYRFQPIELAGNLVLRARGLYLETGPKVLLASGFPNERQRAVVANHLYVRDA